VFVRSASSRKPLIRFVRFGIYVEFGQVQTVKNSTAVIPLSYVTLADLGSFRGGYFGNPSEQTERTLRVSGLTGDDSHF